MNFDKIKKTAKDTFKMVSDKIEDRFSGNEDEPNPKPSSNPLDIDDFSTDEDILGNTRKFDMSDALSHFKKRKNGFEGNLSDVLNDDTLSKSHNETATDDLKSTIQKTDETVSAIESDISDISVRWGQELSNINSRIKALGGQVDSLFTTVEKSDASMADVSKRLGEILISISGINKITDSIFDLKNAQMNTKNTLSDLEVSFRRLKNRMTVGVVTLSVISAVIVILEIINLFS